MNIHSTALVDPAARLAPDVKVGPWSLIGPEVELGAGCVVGAHCILEGRVRAGEKNLFGHGCIVGSPPQDFAFDPSARSEVRLGSGNTLREYVTIHRGTQDGTATTVGDNCFLMAGAHLGHNVSLGSHVVIANGCLLAGYVEAGDGCVLGGGCVFHQFIRIGSLAMIRGGSRFSKDIPPYCVADTTNKVRGINAVGLRRAGVPSPTRSALRGAFRRIFLSRANTTEVVAEMLAEDIPVEVRALLDFIRSSKRGVCASTPDLGDGDD